MRNHKIHEIYDKKELRNLKIFLKIIKKGKKVTTDNYLQVNGDGVIHWT